MLLLIFLLYSFQVSKCINVTLAATSNPIITVRVATNALFEGVTTPVTLRGIPAQPLSIPAHLESALSQLLCPPALLLCPLILRLCPLILPLCPLILLLCPLILLLCPLILPLCPLILPLCPDPPGVPPDPCSASPDQQPRPAVSGLVAARVKLKVTHFPKCDIWLYAKIQYSMVQHF